MVKLPEYMPDNVKFDTRHLYMLSILMNSHKDGRCAVEDVYRTALMVDSNYGRSRKIANGFINDDKCVRSVDGETVYLCSLRKPFGKRLGTFEDDELHSFTTFRDNLILRTLIKVKRISAKSAAKRFNVTSKTIFNIVRKLREEGRLEVVNNYIVINSEKCSELVTVKVPNSNKRAVRAANSYYDPDDRNSAGVLMYSENVIEVAKNSTYSRGKTGRYYDGSVFWTLKNGSEPMDNYKIYSMTVSREGAREIFKFMDRCDGKKRK